jgi:YVTN family beta-propeller protein
MVGGGSVWVTDWHNGTLYLLDPATGEATANVDVGPLPHFAAPTLSHGQVFIGTMYGVVALK